MVELPQFVMVDPFLLFAGFLAVLGIVFVSMLVWHRNAEMAAERTRRKVVGVSTGVLGVGIAVAVEGLHLVAEFPGIVIGLIGLGGIMQGLSVEVAAAIMVVTYVVLAGIRGEP